MKCLNDMNCNRIFRIAGMAACALLPALFVGCTQSLKSTANAEGAHGMFQRSTSHEASGLEYVIDPPDEITIRAPNIKEIDASKQTVRADGKISLNLLGEVKVSGLTPGQVQQELTKIAAKFYTNPDIKVEVVANSKFYTIFGRGANNQKKVAYTGNDNVIRALAEAGLSENAWPQQVLLVRPERPGTPPAVAVIDFKRMSETGDFSQNYVLHEGDIINLRDSPLSSFNFKFTQIVGPISGASEAGTSARAVTGH